MIRFSEMYADFRSELKTNGLRGYCLQTTQDGGSFHARDRWMCRDVCEHFLSIALIDFLLDKFFQLDLFAILAQIPPTDDFMTGLDIVVTWFETGKSSKSSSEAVVGWYDELIWRILTDIGLACWVQASSPGQLLMGAIVMNVFTVLAVDAWVDKMLFRFKRRRGQKGLSDARS